MSLIWSFDYISYNKACVRLKTCIHLINYISWSTNIVNSNHKQFSYIYIYMYVYIYVYIYIYRFQNVFLRCPTPRLHCFLSSHWPSFRFLSFMAFPIPSIQFFFGLPRALFCFGIHFNAILGNLPSTILWTWPYHLSWFCSISFLIVSSSPICFLIVTFLILFLYSRGSPQDIHLCSFDPSLIIFCQSPCFGTIQ